MTIMMLNKIKLRMREKYSWKNVSKSIKREELIKCQRVGQNLMNESSEAKKVSTDNTGS